LLQIPNTLSVDYLRDLFPAHPLEAVFRLEGMNMDRSYIAIRREQGKPDVRTHFPEDPAVRALAVEWCRSEGYKVIGDELTKTPDDAKFAGTIVVTVEPKPTPQMCPTCHKLGIVEVVEGKTYYTHKQTVTLGSGTANFGFQSCPVPPVLQK
jgi:hypothetical protein